MAKTGMVIVSHSEEIANGVVKLAAEMANEPATVVWALPR